MGRSRTLGAPRMRSAPLIAAAASIFAASSEVSVATSGSIFVQKPGSSRSIASPVSDTKEAIANELLPGLSTSPLLLPPAASLALASSCTTLVSA